MVTVTPKAVEKIREAFQREGVREDCVWACWAAAAPA